MVHLRSILEASPGIREKIITSLKKGIQSDDTISLGHGKIELPVIQSDTRNYLRLLEDIGEAGYASSVAYDILSKYWEAAQLFGISGDAFRDFGGKWLIRSPADLVNRVAHCPTISGFKGDMQSRYDEGVLFLFTEFIATNPHLPNLMQILLNAKDKAFISAYASQCLQIKEYGWAVRLASELKDDALLVSIAKLALAEEWDGSTGLPHREYMRNSVDSLCRVSGNLRETAKAMLESLAAALMDNYNATHNIINVRMASEAAFAMCLAEGDYRESWSSPENGNYVMPQEERLKLVSKIADKGFQANEPYYCSRLLFALGKYEKLQELGLQMLDTAKARLSNRNKYVYSEILDCFRLSGDTVSMLRAADEFYSELKARPRAEIEGGVDTLANAFLYLGMADRLAELQEYAQTGISEQDYVWTKMRLRNEVFSVITARLDMAGKLEKTDGLSHIAQEPVRQARAAVFYEQDPVAQAEIYLEASDCLKIIQSAKDGKDVDRSAPPNAYSGFLLANRPDKLAELSECIERFGWHLGAARSLIAAAALRYFSQAM